LKSRKSREGWSRDQTKKDATKREKVATSKKKDAPPKNNTETKKESDIDNDELTDKQRLFCMYYTKYFNATKAYQKVYECDYFSAKSNGYRLMTNDYIREEITRLKQELANGIMLDSAAVLQKYIDIAFADITDFVEFGTIEKPEYDEDGEPILDPDGKHETRTVSFVDFKDYKSVDGTIITEVKQGRDGVSVKLAD